MARNKTLRRKSQRRALGKKRRSSRRRRNRASRRMMMGGATINNQDDVNNYVKYTATFETPNVLIIYDKASKTKPVDKLIRSQEDFNMYTAKIAQYLNNPQYVITYM
jgi:hypothetical protein